MKKKKLLMLGGAYSQIPAIKYAKEAGYYVITCDYLPGNPGHEYSDEYYNISTTDKEGVLCLAKKLKIDGIVAYASDPSAPSAAYVSDTLGLPGPSYQSVKLLAEKDLFRNFLSKNGFNYPGFISISDINDINKINVKDYPLFVKPVDSSGSKGITRVENELDLMSAVNYAMTHSRCKRVIVEEHIDTPYCQLHGDGFVYEGELVFLGLCDHYFKNEAPIASAYPARINKEQKNEIKREVSRLIKLVGFECGAINVEARINNDDQIYIMETGPRSGGNYIPQLMQCGTGFNEVAAIIETALGNKPVIKVKSLINYCMQYIIGTDQPGIFSKMTFDKSFKNKIQALFLHKKEGEMLNLYKDSSNVLGVLIAKCKSAEDLEETINNIKNYLEVIMQDK